MDFNITAAQVAVMAAVGQHGVEIVRGRNPTVKWKVFLDLKVLHCLERCFSLFLEVDLLGWVLVS